ncbi:DUF433 domain-containing protein [Turneriella parva]|uniref:DUF433 domain-containing protein n=1 Tax=Turneriella parva (strain ATCC BAA-1111 / DSM 21527 / NCTC 11395 / H) TaxID=869212 RepID=I4B4Y5_TURPD|nr:DUF433 domain-containing protein [Turneriella parva]AFM12342.1 protein of unknown function DUF433 [Turneriella parva DSM 21527]
MLAKTEFDAQFSSMNVDWLQCSVVVSEPGVLSGAYHFKGTRVPIEALFANLADGSTIDEFLTWFPGVSRQDAEAVLRFAAEILKAPQLV